MMLVREGLIGLLVMTVESGSTGFDSYWEHSEFYFSQPTFSRTLSPKVKRKLPSHQPAVITCQIQN